MAEAGPWTVTMPLGLAAAAADGVVLVYNG